MDMALSSIQPLRDLSRNWDVDVASCLEEYLQELAGIHPQQLKNLAARESTADGNSRNLVTRESNEGKNNNNNRKKNECYEVPNFAHAALILQNSSNVYSRKVDYLFTLVFKALDEFFDASKIASLTSSSSAASKRRGNKPAVDSDVDDFFQYDPQEWFLLLDDVVPEDRTQKKINMKEEEDEEEENKGPSIFGRRDRTSDASSTNTSTNKNDVTHLSLGATLAGLNVTKLDRTSSGGTYGTSISSGSKSSVQQQRALLGILNNGSLRLMAGQCDVGEDGILLMPGSQSSSNSNSKGNNSTIDGTVTNESLMTNRDSLGDGDNTEKNDNINMNNNNNNEQLPPQAGTDIDIDGGPKNLFGDTVHNDDMNVNTNSHDDDDNDHYDNDDEGPGFVMNDNDDNENDDDGGMSSGAMAMDIEENVATVGSTLSSSLSTKRVAFAESTEEQELERRRKQQQHQQEEQKKKERVDPWALLDPHSMGDSSYTLKPLKKGKTYRLPKGITRPPSECVTGSATIHHPPPPPPPETSMNQSILILKHKTRRMKRATITQPPTINRTGKGGLFQLRPSLAVETFRVAMGKQLPESIDLQNKINFRGLAYGEEFLYIAKQNAKLRAAKRREEKKQQQGTTTTTGGTTPPSSYDEQQQQFNSGENNNDDYGDGDDDDNGAGFDFGGGGGDYDDDDDDDNDNNNDNNANTGNAGMSSLDEAFQRNRNNGSGDGTGTGTGDGSSAAGGGEAGQTFEELCRAHIQAFAKSAEKFALTTKLSDRISQWQKYLQPILDEEEQKTTFDIHRYGQMLLETAMKARAEAAAEAAAAASRAMEEEDDDNETQKKRSSTEQETHDLLDFEVVTRGCTRSDICRMFLASLTLANAGNIKIEEGMDGYKFDIITDKVENPMETYQAPSTQDEDDED